MSNLTDADDFEDVPAHLAPEAAHAYLDARVQGICHAGALEIAEGIQMSLQANAAPCVKSPAS